MHYIVFDLEFNQDLSSLQNFNTQNTRSPFEIIQIGAIKLDAQFHQIDTFNRYVKPTFYGQVSPFITELTGITFSQLQLEETFPQVYKDYIDFIVGTDSVFCIWGLSDIKELFRNANYHDLNSETLPRQFINIQPYAPIHLKLSNKKLMKLEDAVSMLHIPITLPFHNAFCDAHYTAEILKKVYHPSIQPIYYDPSYRAIRPKQTKKQIDFDRLIGQFKKMYGRNMSDEEQEIIKLAYKMGKTNQFLK